MKFAVIVFPGSNCDEDAYHAANDVLGQSAEYIWHKDTDLKGADVVILPGGFAHGDYLRTGAMARFSPDHARGPGVRRARRPGARHLQRVSDAARGGSASGRDAAEPGLKYRCEHVHLRVEQTDTPFTGACRAGRCSASRSRTARATTSPPPDVLAAARGQPAGDLSLYRAGRRGRRDGESERIGQRRSPACATTRATSSG